LHVWRQPALIPADMAFGKNIRVAGGRPDAGAITLAQALRAAGKTAALKVMVANRRTSSFQAEQICSA
jgi:hypothetical protein